MKNIRTDTPSVDFDGPEHDACAIYMSARKQGQSTFGTLKRSLGALVNMGHRTGFVNGEGDGAGVQTDIPRRLWGRKLSQAGLPAYLATNPGFWVGHLFIPGGIEAEAIRQAMSTRFNEAGLNLLLIQPGRVRKEALGQSARINPPSFWQLAGYADIPDIEQRLLSLQAELERDFPVQFSSLSSHSVVYKMRGSVEALSQYFPDLQDHQFDTAIVLCHARYSTNTVSTFERAQPFSILGHNGEINTIQRLRIEARQIGVNLPRDGSDSQDLDRVLHTLCVGYGLDLIEAMEMVFPPVPKEMALFPDDLKAAYERIRQSFGPYAQGPAGIIARFGNTIVASVDALGLRPLWFAETEKEYMFSSERGAIPMDNMVTEPRALAPGEKMAILFHRGENPVVLDHNQIRQHVMIQTYQREAPQLARQYWSASLSRQSQIHPEGGKVHEVTATEKITPGIPHRPEHELEFTWPPAQPITVDTRVLAANGWLKDHLNEIHAYISEDKEELVSSLGYDGPLAALSHVRVNIADYFKESVAVVTNPAIDHDRESEAFSTSSLVGACPAVGKAPDPDDCLVVLGLPFVLGGHRAHPFVGIEQQVAKSFGIKTLEDLLVEFGSRAEKLDLGVPDGMTTREAMEALAEAGVDAVRQGCQCLFLDDSRAVSGEYGWMDPHLAVSKLDQTLRDAPSGERGNLRRRAGLLVRSASIRSLHDIAMLCGMGVDAVNPYAMISTALQQANSPDSEVEVEKVLRRFVQNLAGGLEKITSTMGCHELRGYGRVCSAIGLAPSLAEVFHCANYFGSEELGLTWKKLDQESRSRQQEVTAEQLPTRLPQQIRIYPKFWKAAQAYANSQVGYGEVRKVYETVSAETPVALRHLVGIKHITDVYSPSEVDISVRGYALPVVIDAMSFGSQGEASFRSYIQAASALNIICINGEGGELPEIMGKYKRYRGQQVASGRFGVNAEFLNSATILEIKIGQGAKPGEGGMLPGFKVSAKVAQARKTPENVTLLSPSNNHDLYSIEDLAQLIEELRMVNPDARISVKIPVVPGIGVIAVGIAKAGADIINICGYDGGTGAARKHSLQYVGLPTEIGIIQAHRALTEAGIRHKVELWANGGMKTGEDVVKMILLGANRVGFATMAMVALGCTICRQCNLGTCHVGIATQIESEEEAHEKGLKHFHPLDCKVDYERIVRMFKGMADEIRQITAQLGTTQLQNLVGRADLLEQKYLKDAIDLSAMFEPVVVGERPGLEPGVGILLIRPRNSLTTILTELVLWTIRDNEREVTYQDNVSAIDRALGSRLAGELKCKPELLDQIDMLHLRFGPSSLAGNGFAAWNTDKIDVLIEGGAQDGVAKGANGGQVAVMKGLNHEGLRIDGSVGKSFAYGAQGGILLVQGNADARACVRLSGAKVLLGGEISRPVDDSAGSIGTNANLKGFACEYMTSGMVLIMGDPGPYAFSGMTGGTVYQKLTLEYGFDLAALKRRLGAGSHVEIQPVEREDITAIQELFGLYITALEKTYQYETADRIRLLAQDEMVREQFVRVTAKNGNSK
jgi:glutamate synthase (NADPH/NADH) large chain